MSDVELVVYGDRMVQPEDSQWAMSLFRAMGSHWRIVILWYFPLEKESLPFPTPFSPSLRIQTEVIQKITCCFLSSGDFIVAFSDTFPLPPTPSQDAFSTAGSREGPEGSACSSSSHLSPLLPSPLLPPPALEQPQVWAALPRQAREGKHSFTSTLSSVLEIQTLREAKKMKLFK